MFYAMLFLMVLAMFVMFHMSRRHRLIFGVFVRKSPLILVIFILAHILVFWFIFLLF